jgi:RTX calcium-binding nonapeptide repeat (4 copies)
MRSETSKKEGKGHTEATEEQAHSERCEETRIIDDKYPSSASASASAVLFTTNDLSGCPKGGLLSGTDKPDKLNGFDGDDEIRGLAGPDFIVGGAGNDVIYAGPGDDEGKGKYVDRNVMGNRGDDVLYGGDGNDTLGSEMGQDFGEDVYYGGGGNDWILARGDRQPDKLYCGTGKDKYFADKIDYVDSSCELDMDERIQV